MKPRLKKRGYTRQKGTFWPLFLIFGLVPEKGYLKIRGVLWKMSKLDPILVSLVKFVVFRLLWDPLFCHFDPPLFLSVQGPNFTGDRCKKECEKSTRSPSLSTVPPPTALKKRVKKVPNNVLFSICHPPFYLLGRLKTHIWPLLGGIYIGKIGVKSGYQLGRKNEGFLPFLGILGGFSLGKG